MNKALSLFYDDFSGSNAIKAKINLTNPYDGGHFQKLTGEVRVYYANSDKLLRKPLLIIDGFDPLDERRFDTNLTVGQKSLWEMLFYDDDYGQHLHLGLRLLDMGYDVVLLNLPDGGAYVEENALVCVEVINRLNEMLLQNNSDEQIVVVGPSMGGQIARYALTYMEQNPNANTNYGKHNTRLCISYDSPHQGANIAMGAQALIEHFADEDDDDNVSNIWKNKLCCHAALQMLIHHRKDTLQQIYNEYYSHLHNLNTQTNGYPSNTRNIAIANGSLNNVTCGIPYQISYEGLVTFGLGSYDFRTRNVVNSGAGNIFDFTVWILFVPIHKEVVFNNNFGQTSPDIAPGCLYNTFDQIESAVKDKTGGFAITVHNVNNHCFMPITSTLDISGNMNYSTDISSRDLVAEGLTPFDSYAGVTDNNMYHVTFNQHLVDYMLNEIETYVQGPREVQLCQTPRPIYTLHLPQDSIPTDVTWLCSDNICIVRTSDPTVVNIVAMSVGDGWISAEVSTLKHRKRLANYPIHVSVNENNNLPVITTSDIPQQTMTISNEVLLPDTFCVGNGKTLTITNTGILHCSPGTRIIVRPGGTLIVDGGTLTSACAGEMWQGIEVVGNRTQHQNAANQGTVILRNGAVVENAHCAIKTGLAGNEWLTTGGIVQCTGSTFKNNRRAVSFYSYADTLASGNIGDNKSWFKDCIFTLNDTNLFLSQGLEFLNHVTLWDVKGVSFEGCTFKNLTTGNIPDRKHGIYALGAGFKVNTLCNTLDGCNCYGAADTSLFAGFSTAVEVGNDGCPYTVTIDEALFENNGTGVSIQACDYATVTRCTFDLSTNPVNTRNTLGLRLDNSAGFHVEGNTFQVAANAPSSDRWGVYVLGSVKQNNSLYRNGFENLTRGVFVTDTNGLGRTGLCFSCNTFTNCAYGIYVSPNGSIAAMQGNLSKGADNSFTGIQTRSLNNLGQTQVNYYHSSNSSFILHNPTGVLTESNLAAVNPCNSTICDQSGNVTPVTGFGELVNSLLTPAGNSTATAQNAPSLEEVSQTYYAAVRRIMADSVESLPDLLAWHTAAGALASPYALTEIFAVMDNSTGVSHTPQSQADAFSVGASHTPPISQPEMDNYADFRALAASLRPSSNNPAVNWPAATPAQIDELQRIAEANTGRSSTMAKGVLCFFFDICYEEEWESGTKAGVYSAKGTDVPQWTYWELALTEPVLYPKTFSLMEDTVLQGQSFRKSDFLMTDPGYHARNVMLKEDSTGMYYWDDILQETRVLYDYTAGEGDIYTVFPFMGDTLYQMKVTVDSVRVDQIDNQLLRVYYVTTASVSYQQPQLNWTFDINGNQHARIVEHIGATGFLLPMETALNDHFYSALCEYSDENIYYHPNDTVSCDEPYVYGLSQHDGSGIRVYPNPAHSSITVTCDRPMHGMVAYNRLGQPVYANANLHGRTEFTLDVSSWPAGLYLLQLTFPNGEQAIRKVVKD